MLKTVDLNDQQFVTAKKVNDVRTERNLPGEFVSVQATTAQIAPEAVFFFRVVLAKVACLRRLAGAAFGDVVVVRHPRCPLIRPFGPPSPRGGEGDLRRTFDAEQYLFSQGCACDVDNRSKPSLLPSGRKCPQGG